jgi:chemotaxis protein CheZ
VSGTDTTDLEDLFDSIADQKLAQFHAEAKSEIVAQAPAKPVVETAPLVPGSVTEPGEMFQRVGQLTRQLHDALRDVGASDVVDRAVREFPDARDRLAYVSRLTEQAAERALTAVEIGQSRQNEMHALATALSGRWEKFFARDITLAEFKTLAQDSRMFMVQAQSTADATNAQLTEIMMAQDFQDLTGQVIQKLTKLVNDFETQLLRFLIEAMPEEKRDSIPAEELAGPVVNAEGRDDIVNGQEQVDDLLESLGF